MIKATANFVFDTRREKKDNTYPIKLSIYFNGKKKLYDAGISFSKTDWSRIKEGKIRDEDLKRKKRELSSVRSKAENIIDTIEDFSFDKFEKQFYAGEALAVKSIDVYKLFDLIIDDLNKDARTGSAVAYETAKKAFQGFRKSLSFQDIDCNFLKNFESSFIQKGHSSTTVGIYCRHLRAVYNKAIELGIAKQEDYPFKKWVIPASRNIKKAMSFDQMKLVLSYMPASEAEAKAKDFWLFSYLCNGMNMKDICRLRYKNVMNEFIVFNRSKTINTKRKDLRPIQVPISEEVQRIINKWGNKPTMNKDTYLFPVLSSGLSPIDERKKIQFFNRNISKQLKKVAQKLNIDAPLTNMSARHSFATVLKRKGVSTEFISESLGHSSLKTTENYLDSFTDDVKKNTAMLLVDF
jgi:integrase/recombinase XerD